jgi:gamma-glutamyltranspeptidase / glutathione hydrolase
MRRFVRFIVCCVLSVSLAAAPAFADATTTPALADVAHHPNGGREGIVVAGEKTAAKIGADMLAQGGNAVDAAVATAFALAVTYPRAGNIGGGGFMLVHMQDEGKTIAIDYREMAPAAATQDMYLDDEGNVDIDAIRHSHKSSGVPGTVAGLLHAHEKYGVLSRKKVMAPAIRLAEKGYTLSYFNAAMFEEERDALTRNAAARAEFFKPDGSGYLPGDVMRRKGLAKTLKAISKHGRDGFYSGWVADAIASDMAANGGLITRDDLSRYKVVEREPVIGTYRGYEIHSMPPPSSGGIHLIQMLNMLETRAPYSSAGDSAEALHFLAETMRLAYADRAELLGDTDFVDVPVQGLMSKEYAKSLASTINPNKAGDSSKIGAGDPAAYESHDTTQFSVIDKDGNFVSNTYTLNMSFGSGVVVPGTGILLNNQMDDFSAAPGVPNYYGLVGNDKNAIAASKRPLSSMTPTLIFKDGAPFMAIGGAGGSRIITSVLQVIINVIDRGMNIGDAMEHPRIHHQWLPDQILYEPGISDDTKALLEAKGHKLTPIDWYARPQTVLYKDGWSYGYSDTRMPGGGACSPDGGC